MKSSSPSTVVTIADARYAWGALMLVASMRKNGMAQPVLVGTHGTWPEAMTRRLLVLGVVHRRDLPLPLRRGAWPLYRLLPPFAPHVWRAMNLRRHAARAFSRP